MPIGLHKRVFIYNTQLQYIRFSGGLWSTLGKVSSSKFLLQEKNSIPIRIKEKICL